MSGNSLKDLQKRSLISGTYLNDALISISWFENPKPIGDVVKDKNRLRKKIPTIVPLQVRRILIPVIGFWNVGESDRKFHIHITTYVCPKYDLRVCTVEQNIIKKKYIPH